MIPLIPMVVVCESVNIWLNQKVIYRFELHYNLSLYRLMQLRLVNRMQKRAVRAITNSDYRAHSSPLFSKLEK